MLIEKNHKKSHISCHPSECGPVQGRRLAKKPLYAALTSWLMLPWLAHANCTTSGNATTCDGSNPSPWTTTIGAGADTPAGATVTVGAGSQIVLGDAPAISLSDDSNIVIGSGALVQNESAQGDGGYQSGSNTIEFRNGNTLTIEQGATVASTGTQIRGEAVNPEGTGNTIINNGTISSTNAAAIWFQTGGPNTVINNPTGLIETALPSGNVLGAPGSGVGSIDFTNRGRVIGSIYFLGGGDTLHAYTGSSISGIIQGGGSDNLLTLNGSGSDTAPTDVTGFQTLLKQDDGTWTVATPLAPMGFTLAEVQQGTLVLAADNSAYTGRLVVDAGATLQANAASLPKAVEDDGLLQFAEDVDGIYDGQISGSGAVEKDGAGTLTLAPGTVDGNTYTGGTLIKQGALSVTADHALGAPTGSITFDGGTLQFGSSFNLADTRAITLADGGGAIDTQAFQTTIAQGIGGNGALTKRGTGMLVLDGNNTWTGGTSVEEGTLAIGDASAPGASVAGNVSIAPQAVLAGYGSVGGDVSNAGTLAVANACAACLWTTSGGFAIKGQLINAGVVQLGGAGVGNTLTVHDYVGQNGVVALNAVLGGDGSIADKLVINGGRATGSTLLQVSNVGGQGGAIRSDGIMVVQAANGGSTDAHAFTLAGGSLKAGAYDYFLVRGGISPGTAQNWYLRNTLSADPIPLYRPEVALYAAAAPVMRELGMLQLENFHQRQGDQSLLQEDGALPAAWERMWGGRSVLAQGGDVDPQFHGSVGGVQIGHDLYADADADGNRNRYGLFAGAARAAGSVAGNVSGQANLFAGNLAISAYSVGGYWTHIGAGNWYTDTVLMNTVFSGHPMSRDGSVASLHGHAVTGSVEAGMPFALGAGVSLEPQAQVIWQRALSGSAVDDTSHVALRSGNTVSERAGVRLVGSFDTWQPYVRLNVIHGASGNDTATFDGAMPIRTPTGRLSGEVDAGVVMKLWMKGSIFVSVSDNQALDGKHQQTYAGNVMLRWAW
jgi:outer membrane autotransporter protein